LRRRNKFLLLQACDDPAAVLVAVEKLVDEVDSTTTPDPA
jgi:hypothetical protein